MYILGVSALYHDAAAMPVTFKYYKALSVPSGQKLNFCTDGALERI